MQIILDESDEELQRRCDTVGDTQRAADKTGDSVPAQQPAAAHYNPTDQSRRLAAYKDLREQDRVDIVYLVCFLHHGGRSSTQPAVADFCMRGQKKGFEYFLLSKYSNTAHIVLDTSFFHVIIESCSSGAGACSESQVAAGVGTARRGSEKGCRGGTLQENTL